MRVFIVDNGSLYLDDLMSIFEGYEVVCVNYAEIDRSRLETDDLVVLSGGHSDPVLWHGKEYELESELVRHHQGPIIGVCLGFQLIAHLFGSHFHLLEARRKGPLVIKATPNASDLLPEAEYAVYENHNWSAPRVGKPLLALATSEDGVEIVKHENRNIYAVQFHPEATKGGDGREILRLIMDRAISRADN